MIFSFFYFLTSGIASALSNEHKLAAIELNERGFSIEGKPFRFIGANAVNLVFYDDFSLSVEEAIRTAKENGISVIRLFLDWGWGKPKDYDEILNLAANYNIYVILTLTDCCCSHDCSNIKEYFHKHAPYCNFTNQESINAFKNRIKQIIMRRNSVNGRVYRNDPTIFAWDIANEPEFWHFSYLEVHEWIREIAGYIKKLDPNHFVTITVATNNAYFDQSSHLYDMLNAAELDFFSFNFYSAPEKWNGEQLGDYRDQIISHISKFLSMGKPVIMAEFGFSPSGELNLKMRSNKETKQLYYKVFKESMDAAFSAGAAGVLFWGWGVPEARSIPMWWASEIHDATERNFTSLINEYRIPPPLDSVRSK
jgi:endo-1,4-beta-mannosidase